MEKQHVLTTDGKALHKKALKQHQAFLEEILRRIENNEVLTAGQKEKLNTQAKWLVELERYF